MRPRGRGLHTSSALDTRSTEAREASRFSICNEREGIMATSGTMWSQWTFCENPLVNSEKVVSEWLLMILWIGYRVDNMSLLTSLSPKSESSPKFLIPKMQIGKGRIRTEWGCQLNPILERQWSEAKCPSHIVVVASLLLLSQWQKWHHLSRTECISIMKNSISDKFWGRIRPAKLSVLACYVISRIHSDFEHSIHQTLINCPRPF